MKFLSIWQPWAQMLAIGEKEYETRSWSTNYRGVLAIHASKKNDLCRYSEPFRSLLRKHGLSYDLPMGCIVGVCRVVDCVSTVSIRNSVSEQEYSLGDFGIGRYAIKVEGAVLLKSPVPMRGMQGIVNVPADVVRLVKDQVYV